MTRFMLPPALLLSVAALAGCGSLSPPAASSAIPQLREPTHTWMAPDAKKKRLLYLSTGTAGAVYVYSYPREKLVGTLSGFQDAEGLCADKRGHVFITDFDAQDIVEYAHGGTSPLATLQDSAGQPQGCAVDKTTGDLAVANFQTPSGGQGGIALYKKARGTPATYIDSALEDVAYCGYDPNGNLYLDGLLYNSFEFGFAELPKGSTNFTNITLNVTLGYPSGVQWDGEHIAVGDFETNNIYQFAIAGSSGTLKGTTPLGIDGNVAQFFIDKSTVVTPDAPTYQVGFFPYPKGGVPSKTLTLSGGRGAVISR
jgi:hypothetical protein